MPDTGQQIVKAHKQKLKFLPKGKILFRLETI